MEAEDFLDELKLYHKKTKHPYKLLLSKNLFKEYNLVFKRINAFDVGDIEKNKLSKIILHHKYNAIVFTLLDWFVELSKLEEKYIPFLSNQMVVIVDRILTRYERMIFDSYTDEINGYGKIYGSKLFDHVYLKFKVHHEDKISFIMQSIQEFETSCIEDVFKIDMFISLCHIAFNMCHIHLEKTMHILNGSVETLTAMARAEKKIILIPVLNCSHVES